MRHCRFFFWWSVMFGLFAGAWCLVATGWFLIGFVAFFVVHAVLAVVNWRWWREAKFRVFLIERIMESIARLPHD